MLGNYRLMVHTALGREPTQGEGAYTVARGLIYIVNVIFCYDAHKQNKLKCPWPKCPWLKHSLPKYPSNRGGYTNDYIIVQYNPGGIQNELSITVFQTVL